LADLRVRLNEPFLYEYDFRAGWQLQVRIEQRAAIEAERPYPVCVGGRRARPPEDCGGLETLLERLRLRRDESRNCSTGCRKTSRGGHRTLNDRLEKLQRWHEWLFSHRFDRRAVNRRLRQYARGDQGWMNS
jgi:hypothetical protein